MINSKHKAFPSRGSREGSGREGQGYGNTGFLNLAGKDNSVHIYFVLPFHSVMTTQHAFNI